MIKIVQGQGNDVRVTLSELTTISDTTFLWVFNHPQQKTDVAVIIADTATAAQRRRYNKFEITEGTTVTLTFPGQWFYKVYAQTSPTNTDPDLADELVEEGIVDVIAPDPTTYSGNAPDNDNFVYKI